jgi:hypothetical protein
MLCNHGIDVVRVIYVQPSQWWWAPLGHIRKCSSLCTRCNILYAYEGGEYFSDVTVTL